MVNGRFDAVGPGTTKRVVVNVTPVLLANVGGCTVDDLCTHGDSWLSLDCIKGGLISYTLHGSRYRMISGEPYEDPATGVLRVEDDINPVQGGS